MSTFNVWLKDDGAVSLLELKTLFGEGEQGKVNVFRKNSVCVQYQRLTGERLGPIAERIRRDYFVDIDSDFIIDIMSVLSKDYDLSSLLIHQLLKINNKDFVFYKESGPALIYRVSGEIKVFEGFYNYKVGNWFDYALILNGLEFNFCSKGLVI